MDASELGLLVALDALLQEQSVSKAARRLGLSTPAVSHTLARLRERFDDQLLVRAGRRMVLTPRAEALRGEVREVIAAAERLYAPPALAIEALERTFVLRATDYVLLVLGERLDVVLGERAPGLGLRVVPNALDDAEALRRGDADLAVGIYGALPPELRARPLISDRFVCVLRAGHPALEENGALSLDAYLALEHVQVAPRGQPGGYVDDTLASLGHARRVSRAVPSFWAAMRMVAGTDRALTVSARVGALLAPSLSLVCVDPPLSLRPYALSMLWHPRFDDDAAHAWLRARLLDVAREVAGEVHPDARRQLDVGDPTTGAARRRRASVSVSSDETSG